MAPSEKPQAWRNSEAKKALVLLLENDVDGRVQQMHHSDVYMMSPLFKAYDPKNFQLNLKNLKDAMKKDKCLADFHREAFEHDRALVPVREVTPRGYPRFDVSSAKALLTKDVREGKHKNIKPADFQKTRPEYGVFPPDVFRKHIYQEEYRQQGSGYWQHRKQAKQNGSSK
jgi:hypothetical protein